MLALFPRRDGAATVPTHQTLQAFKGKRPILGSGAFVAPNACVIGDVKLGTNSSVWYGAVLRGTPLHIIPLVQDAAGRLQCELCSSSRGVHEQAMLYSTVVMHTGDVNHITVGDNTNIQDGVTVHVARHNPQGKVAPTVIGNNVTVGGTCHL